MRIAKKNNVIRIAKKIVLPYKPYYRTIEQIKAAVEKLEHPHGLGKSAQPLDLKSRASASSNLAVGTKDKNMTDDPKQVIVIRKDLNMRKGKIVAQGAHASLGALLDVMRITYSHSNVSYTLHFNNDSPVIKWLENKFTKICVYVTSEQELIDIYDKARRAGIPCTLITDAGLTEFHGVPTKTCAGIGPWSPDIIDQITGHLKLL